MDNVSGSLTDACCQIEQFNYVSDSLSSSISSPAPIIIRDTSIVEFFLDTAMVEINWQIESKKDPLICSAIITSIDPPGKDEDMPVVYNLDGILIIENCKGCKAIKIIDITGKTLYLATNLQESRVVLPYTLPNGSYILLITGEQGTIRAKIAVY